LDQVCFRIDFPNWLHSLARRDRKLALALAMGYSTSEVAKRFSLSPGRISQLRREFFASWGAFQGEGSVGGRACPGG
jgi:hypothetical protein